MITPEGFKINNTLTKTWT